jgi:hypothetical protein
MNIQSTLNSLNLVCYEYDSHYDMLKVKENASRNYLHKELTKITYYLTSKNIIFDVLYNKSILIGKKDSLLLKLKRAFYL